LVYVIYRFKELILVNNEKEYRQLIVNLSIDEKAFLYKKAMKDNSSMNGVLVDLLRKEMEREGLE
jgi:hypothetical protein